MNLSQTNKQKRRFKKYLNKSLENKAGITAMIIADKYCDACRWNSKNFPKGPQGATWWTYGAEPKKEKDYCKLPGRPFNIPACKTCPKFEDIEE